ncbi:MAG TPA: DNA polymerase IV, partial [Acidimicrobiales bacterium]|nr:DNA polymerase IV [Acidimicrobiales bacterium]
MADRVAGTADRGSRSSRASPHGDPAILHVDMDAFFAAVEVRDDPSLAGKPVIVGGRGRRGVVAACTYEARRFGVHSAMSSVEAYRRCPSAVFVDGHHHRYAEVSGQLHAILRSVTPLVEGISLDEAYLDVRGARRTEGAGADIAWDIRRRVRAELDLGCSVGVGASKLIAKLASKAAKPRASASGIEPGRGVVVVGKEDERAFLRPLPVRALPGVGPATARRLHELGITTVGELADLPAGTLERAVGVAAGRQLAAMAGGDDRRPVVPEQAPKSIGHEETFATDLWDAEDLRARLLRMVEASAALLRSSRLRARTVTVKARLSDFSQCTRSHTLGIPVDTEPAIGAVAVALLDSLERPLGVRLLGVSLSGLGPASDGLQLAFDLEVAPDEQRPGEAPRARMPTDDQADHLQRSWQAVVAAVDSIRARYGGTSVGP